jgi:hypothetical protein
MSETQHPTVRIGDEYRDEIKRGTKEVLRIADGNQGPAIVLLGYHIRDGDVEETGEFRVNFIERRLKIGQWVRTAARDTRNREQADSTVDSEGEPA